MSCPNYKDYTRLCAKKYSSLVRFRDFSKCETEYQKCIIYHILNSDFQCKYLDSCLMMFPETIPELLALMNRNEYVYEFMTKPVHEYCLSKENFSHCARYKIKEEGSQPPPGLSPNGINLNFTDFISKQKTIA